MSRFAVIDIGTNTCNLLIANVLSDKSFDTVYDRKLPVKLGRGGIHKDILLPDAIQRGLDALSHHSVTIREYNVTKVKVVGTSAIRGAANKGEFLKKVKLLLDWDIEILDGKLEAELIFIGVRLSLPTKIGKYLIVDIGGGSVEFILANDNQIIWKNSFNIGIARVLETFSISDPVMPIEVNSIERWFDEQLKELWLIAGIHNPQTLVGCSGAFDTFMDIYEKEAPDLKIRGVSELPINDYIIIHDLLINTNKESRSKLPGMDLSRVEMIVIASVFTNFILRRLDVKKLIHTHNALKEGVMAQLISI
jgi:exopolyphosphatase/guanosine-5'-triphosphate,3'-diphosphate pyrophosphatase